MSVPPNMATRLLPALAGPNITAVMGAIETVLAETFGVLGEELVSAMDTRPPAWLAARPLWHLTWLESSRPSLLPVPAASAVDRYRAVRMHDVGEWSQGLWPDLLRLAAAWLQSDRVDPAQLRVFAHTLSTVWLFAPNVQPTADNLAIFKGQVLATIQDVAGYALMVGIPGLVFTFDLGPGFDIGSLAEIIAQEG